MKQPFLLASLLIVNASAFAQDKLVLDSMGSSDRITVNFTPPLQNDISSNLQLTQDMPLVRTWTAKDIDVDLLKMNFTLFSIARAGGSHAGDLLTHEDVGLVIGTGNSMTSSVAWEIDVVPQDMAADFIDGPRTFTASFSFITAHYSNDVKPSGKWIFWLACRERSADGFQTTKLKELSVVAPDNEMMPGNSNQHTVDLSMLDFDFATCKDKGGVTLNFHSITTSVFSWRLDKINWSINQKDGF